MLGPDWLDPEQLAATVGLIGVLIIVFAECGLLIGFFLPGDSLLFATGLLVLLAWQLVSGLSNVVLGWPLVAAVAHTAGAALLVIVMATLLARLALGARAGRPAMAASPWQGPAGARA